MQHRDTVAILDPDGSPVRHDPAFVSRVFDEELERLIGELPRGRDRGTAATLREARKISEEIVLTGRFDPE
jgi:hypothetical protein